MSRSTTSYEPYSSSDRQTPPDGPQVELIIIRGRTRQRVRPIAGRVFLIGAAEDCDLVLVDEQFAPVNGYLIRSAECVQLRWLSAEPELTINGQPRDNATLADLDRIRTGSYEFLVRIYATEPVLGEPAHPLPAPHAWGAAPAGGEPASAAAGASRPMSHGLNRHVARVTSGRLRLFDGPGRERLRARLDESVEGDGCHGR